MGFLHSYVCYTDLPIAKTATSDSSVDVAETVVTHSSPSTAVIDFQTSSRWWRAVHQPHCRVSTNVAVVIGYRCDIYTHVYTVSQKDTWILLPITLANSHHFQLFLLLNSAINLQQNVYYIAQHTLNVLLHYLVISRWLILLNCKQNKC